MHSALFLHHSMMAATVVPALWHAVSAVQTIQVMPVVHRPSLEMRQDYLCMATNICQVWCCARQATAPAHPARHPVESSSAGKFKQHQKCLFKNAPVPKCWMGDSTASSLCTGMRTGPREPHCSTQKCGHTADASLSAQSTGWSPRRARAPSRRSSRRSASRTRGRSPSSA